MVLDQDFKEFIKLLNSNNVAYLIVGGYAVARYGYTRFTGDLDIWIKPDKENSYKVVKTLNDFGFGSLNLSTDDFSLPDQIIQLGYPPNRIDLITGISGVTFDECYAESNDMNIDDLKIKFISLHHLRINKEKTSRDKDINDLKNLPEG